MVPPHSSATEPPTVLVVEDDPLNLKLVRALLELEGYSVIGASTGERGIELARDHMPDLILMDIQLPGMDGLEVTRRIKRDEGLRHIPVLALSSYAMKQDIEAASAAGCAEYLTKPIENSAFVKTVSRYVS